MDFVLRFLSQLYLNCLVSSFMSCYVFFVLLCILYLVCLVTPFTSCFVFVVILQLLCLVSTIMSFYIFYLFFFCLLCHIFYILFYMYVCQTVNPWKCGLKIYHLTMHGVGFFFSLSTDASVLAVHVRWMQFSR